MNLKVVFLGTAGSVPTPKRSLPAILVKRKGEQLLFDCGEGVQKQMIIAGASFHKKMKVFITHMHGDHVLGLPGLIQTMALLDRDKKLEVYGPHGIRKFIECVRETVQFGLTFPIEIYEIGGVGTVCNEHEYTVQAVWANHLTPSLAYALVEKPRPGRFHTEKAKALGVPEGPLWGQLQRGKAVRLSDGRIVKPEDVLGPSRRGRKIVYTGDTRPFDGLAEFAANADLLIHDATLDDELAERAEEDGHSTPSQAAKIAKKAKAKRLVLTHISARYKNTSKLLKQAKKIFKNTFVAEDFLEIEIPLSDK
ncbi:MAG: ribonuclease Z [Candidatus Bathyarchaeota archaeon]|jgi:ribonuclease Z|nr:ribonuclease Z [Candidatus Bathyarchaeota archaeon A05DMB-3]MDH7606748.1 ribonuclease Z [Candidatus Bathyarchaeota archaeon]